MYVYRVRRDCLNCAVWCFTVDRWEFQRSTRHCMEFKITKDKIARWNKMLLLLSKIKKMYSPCLVSAVHLAYFVVFSSKFESVARFFSPTQRRIVHWSPYPVSVEKSSNFLLQFERFLLHYWSFQLSDAACYHPPDYGTAWQMWLIRLVHSQKLPLKYNPLPNCAHVW